MSGGAGVYGPPPLPVVEDKMAVVSGRLPQSERDKNLRQLVKPALKALLVLALIYAGMTFVDQNRWQSNCTMTGGQLIAPHSCFYPAHTVFGGPQVPDTTEYYKFPLLP